MRVANDVPPRPGVSPRRRLIGIILVALFVVGILSLRSLSILWTDQLWFSSLGISSVFSTLLEVKIGLGLCFGVFYFLLLFGNLLLADRMSQRDLSFDDEDEFVRRFQDFVRPYSRRIYALVSLVAGFFAGMAATGQWNAYLLFANAQSFHRTDPLFHKDLGFYIFKLPFANFVVTWLLGATVSVIVLTAVTHYLNGGIRAGRGGPPRVLGYVKVHLSVLLAVVAILKAGGYLIAKWQLVVSSNGYVDGAGYADVHARIPALTILFFLSLAAAVILLVNIRNRGWSLPILAVGLWAFVALTIGVIYPAALQAFKVTPAQGSLEKPYIERNINATRQAYNLENVKYHNFFATNSLTNAQLRAATPTLSNIRLWDPANNIGLETVQRLQALKGFYTFTTLGVDRYYVNGKLAPVLIGARQVNADNLSSQTWANVHLVYTHGIGAALLAANQVDTAAGGYPVFQISNVPPVSTSGLPTLTEPDVYFGINYPGWIVANTKQPEFDYSLKNGSSVSNHYHGKGGIAVGGFARRVAIALRFGDYNLLISSQINANSRILFMRDVTDMARKAAPFITWDAHPYAVAANGSLKYVVDGYTTTSQYPYSENASNQNVSQDTGLGGDYNYVRNSVKAVIDAYDGSMTLYANDPSDPILQAYRAAFPHLFKPLTDMPTAVRSHLRYPEDIFSIQAATLGRYHITSPSAFYTASDKWGLSPTTGAGRPAQSLKLTQVTTVNGQILSSSLSPMDPIYQVMALPTTSTQQLTETLAYVPAGASSTVQSLTGFIMATSDPDNYGQLNVYVTPNGTNIVSPVQADSEIQQAQRVSTILTPLDQHGSHVLLGNNLMVPLDSSILYVRPLYVTSESNPLPQLKYVICVFDQKVGIEQTLAGALADVFGGSNSITPGTGNNLSAAQYLQLAAYSYSQALQSLRQGDLASYQNWIKKMNSYVLAAQSALAKK